MRDLGVIFSAPMVEALVDDRKTQTRRLRSSPIARLEAGDLIWVRETWGTTSDFDDWKPRLLPSDCPVQYVAAPEFKNIPHQTASFQKKKPAIHMPRFLSRITLIVREVRFQPLQDISERDCIAEGARLRGHAEFGAGFSILNGPMVYTDRPSVYATPRCWYRELWSSLHTAEGQRWDDNPEVVAVSFTVIKCNIDKAKERL